MTDYQCTGLSLKRTFSILASMLVLNNCSPKNGDYIEFPPAPVIPSAEQVTYQQMELIGFIHFSINTFTGKEWGYGDENPLLFNPSELNVEQWVLAAKSGGLKELILTAKHHDGFCLWPSSYTEHSVRNSPYKNGNGDIVREFAEACRKHGLKIGLYLSPWDRNHKDYGRQEYITYYRNQIRELLTEYGQINEIWFDGANGGDGYYGGANETRRIDRKTYYGWDSTFRLVKELQPGILIFSDAGPDIRWVGNEKGYAGETFWSTIKSDNLIIGASNPGYLNTGDPDGDKWLIGQCDVSIRPGWFYHKEEDPFVKTAEELIDIYYKSVGRNGILLINLPPDQRGIIHEKDVASLMTFKEYKDETFSKNLAEYAVASATNYRLTHPAFHAGNMLDNNPGTFWAADDSIFSAELIIDPGRSLTFDRIVLQEPVDCGQRISKFSLLARIENEWKIIYEGTTIGYKRILKIDPFTSSMLKLQIQESLYPPVISEFGLYMSPQNFP
ncbi:MAG: alpha-L-fucosidase [Bacteroidales bacterium]|nr:alpha-L-fucosidase [Bacteroidales bacterium]